MTSIHNYVLVGANLSNKKAEASASAFFI